MDTTAIAVVESQEAVSLLESPLSPAETAELQSCELAIELAGKDRLEKALIIGEKLSTIYNHALFRGPDGGQKWDVWVRNRLPQLLPEAEGKSTQWADDRRFLYECRALIAPSAKKGLLPTKLVDQARHLVALIPRNRLDFSGNWQPAILDDPEAAQGIAKVWELACQNAEENQRRNSPTAEDVRAAREELRPALEQQGLIRSAPASFQAATAARVEAARHRTIDITPPNPAEQERFRETMAQIRDTKAERQASVDADEVRQQLDQSEQQRISLLQQEVRAYNQHLTATASAIHALKVYMDTLSRVHGTQILDNLREVTVLGLISVADDMDRLQSMGQELVDVAKLAQTSAPPTGINMETIEV